MICEFIKYDISYKNPLSCGKGFLVSCCLIFVSEILRDTTFILYVYLATD